VSTIAVELGQKRLQLLRDLVPNAVGVGFLMNPGSPNTAFDLGDMQAAARGLGQQLVVVNARDEREIDTAFSDLAQKRVAAVVVQPEPFLFSRRNQLVALAAHHAIPAINFDRAFPAAGGLMSYGPDFREVNRQAGIYTGLVLKGANPADLPVVQSTKFELVINLRAAKVLGVDVPATLLTLADEVIE
jgi:putative tryptophan/tyrosine transport system substrate-binding protein